MSVSGDAIMSGDIPNEQIAAYSKDSDECGVGLTPDLNEYDDTQWQALYDLTIQNVTCLEDSGFSFDDVPSFQTFRGLMGKWSAYLELLDNRAWTTKQELASAMFSWIEGWYNPRRRHSSLGYHSPADYEKINTSETTLAA